MNLCLAVDPVMQASSSSSNSGHSSTDMYYTHALFGHPLFAPSAILHRDNNNANNNGPGPPSQAAPPTAAPPSDDFIELDVHSESATTNVSGDEAEPENPSTSSTSSNPPNAFQ